MSCDKIPHEECRDVEKTRQVEVPWQECSQEVASEENPDHPSAATVVNLSPKFRQDHNYKIL